MGGQVKEGIGKMFNALKLFEKVIYNHYYRRLHTHTHEVKTQLYYNRATISLIDIRDYLINSPVPKMGYFFWSGWPSQ